jgi:organic radical activating enzyme
MTKPFCNYLTSQLRFEYDFVSPCCWYFKKGNISDIDSYRKELFNISDWTPDCHYCKKLEDQSIISPRQDSLNNPERFGLSENSDEITALDIQIDADCNAACLICGPYNSVTWQKHNLGNVSKATAGKIINIKNERTVDRRIKKIKSVVDFSKIKKIVFLGGEPFKSDSHLEILKSVPDLSKIMISYVTNGSMLPSTEVLEIIKQANDVQISISIDAIENQFNYLRWPLQWKQVESNIKFLENLKWPNLTLAFSHAVTPFNIFYHDRYVAWARETLTPNLAKFGFGHPFKSEGTINLSCIPPKLIEVLHSKYTGKMHSLRNMDNITSLIDSFDPVAYKKFMEYITLEDQKRNLNWREIFPEISQYFTDDLLNR